MKIWLKSVLIATAISLAGCGGFDDVDAVRDATMGSSGNTDSNDNNGNAGSDAKCFEPNVLNTTSVIDGDTVEVIPVIGKSERVRLLGIDAPESQQEYGSESTAELSQCVNNAIVTIEWTERDRYDRLLGKVIANNADCNLNQLQKGQLGITKNIKAAKHLMIVLNTLMLKS